MSESSSSSSGISVFGLLWVALIVLKILGYVQWGWFAVITSIVWIPIALILMWIAIIFGLGALGFGGAMGGAALIDWVNKIKR